MKKYLIFVISLIISTSAMANKAYVELNSKKINEDKVVVQEFFYYGCPHCKNLEKKVEEWKSSIDTSKIKFEQVPVDYGFVSIDAAKHHYTAEMFGVLDEFKKIYFHNIINKKRKISDKLAIDIMVSLGANRNKAEEGIDSFFINKKVERIKKLTREYKIMSVPSFVVNGKYYTDLTLAKNPSNLFKQIEKLGKK
jgi:thiol:disulfide interchange protein DsbA